MRKRPTPKKPVAAKPKRVTFRVTVEAQVMLVSYEPDWMPDTGHFEYRSPHKPARRTPVSPTGYLSHFVPMEDVNKAESPQAFARDEALAIMRCGRRTVIDEVNQLPLFG